MKFLRLLLVLFIISALALAGVAYWIYNSMNTAHKHEKAKNWRPKIFCRARSPSRFI
jgi:flagellar basal body-associated protein FliL